MPALFKTERSFICKHY